MQHLNCNAKGTATGEPQGKGSRCGPESIPGKKH